MHNHPKKALNSVTDVGVRALLFPGLPSLSITVSILDSQVDLCTYSYDAIIDVFSLRKDSSTISCLLLPLRTHA